MTDFEIEKTKSCGVKEYCACDRLSELPDSLILIILEFLPITDAVQTTILSKRWKSLWLTVERLNIKYDEKINIDKLFNLVKPALNSWRGIKIERLNIDLYRKLEKPIAKDIDLWLRFAMEKRVEELHLCLRHRSHVKLCLVGKRFYSCSSLRVLNVRNCVLKINGNVQWDQLKRLTIECVGLSENVIDRVLCGSPRLEDLILVFCERKENLSIRSKSLKMLIIKKLISEGDDDASTDGELRIWTPNLETLRIMGVPYSKCLLMDVSSLTEAVVKFDDCRSWPHQSSGNDFVGETLTQILPKIEHVERLTLSDWCFKALAAVKEKHMLSSFPNANFFKFKVCSHEYKEIVGVLEMFPKLRNLVLQTTSKRPRKYATRCVKFDGELPGSFLQQLRTVDVTWTMGDNSIFQLIQILLKYARNLEKMVFWEKRTESPTPWESLFVASQELLRRKASKKFLRMQKSFPTVEFIFC